MVKKLEVLVFGGLLGAPCVIILSKCAASLSLFAVHPAANAVAFLVCFPLYALPISSTGRCGRIAISHSIVVLMLLASRGLYVMLERKRLTDFRTRCVWCCSHFYRANIAIVALTAFTIVGPNRVLLVQTHLFSHVIAMLCLSIVGLAAFLTKNAFGKAHLTSTHSWVAVVTSLLSALNLFGVRIA